MSSSSSWVELLDQDLENLSNSKAPNIHSSLIKSRKNKTKSVTLRHFLHEHPLVLTKYVKRKIKLKISFKIKVAERNEATQICEICGEYIGLDGQFYQCKKCRFSIHKTCAELPKQVTNMLHPAHPLELSKQLAFHCIACDIVYGGCSSYRCSICDFDLDIKCVSRNIFEEPQGHKEHKFVFMRPALFTCDACGRDQVTKSRISSMCTTCLLHVHTECSFYSFPFTIKEPRHSHKLSLTYSFQMGHVDFADKFCKICFKKMNDVHFMYSCAECDAYITHVCCGERNNVLDVGVVTETENQELSRPSITSLDLNETHQNDQIEHFSHPHSLFLINVDEPKGDNIICDGCVRPISAPFHTCDQCNFFLHQHCIELPKTIIHPLHEHELTLQTAWDILSADHDDSFDIPGYSCDGCNTLCNGFIYECRDCYFHLDVGCSFLPDILRHEGHSCELTLIDMSVVHGVNYLDRNNPKYQSNCTACGLGCLLKFICEQCNFDLDLVCASLPQTIPHECPKHEWKKHPYKLKYHDIENVAGMYICDECEEERRINHWYYYCEDCKYSAHPRCLLGHHRTKYGRSFEIHQHPHRVRLLKEPRLGWNHSCLTCMEPLAKSGPALSCQECNIYIHCDHNICCSLIFE